MRYLDVAAQLRDRLGAGRYAPTGSLPSETELASELGASRVTIRRALEVLRRQGLVTSRRGSGWFVTVDPVRQPLGRVTTIEAAVAAAGATSSRRVLEFAFEPAPAVVAHALEMEAGADVLRVRRVNLADGEPFALVTVWVPGALGASLSRRDVEASTLLDLLPIAGVELGRATQTIGAELALADDAELLGLQQPAALIVCRRVTCDATDRPVIYSEHRYPAARTTFEIEFPSVAFEEARLSTGAPHG
jgi:GntR family transcriptional regulator